MAQDPKKANAATPQPQVGGGATPAVTGSGAAKPQVAATPVATATGTGGSAAQPKPTPPKATAPTATGTGTATAPAPKPTTATATATAPAPVAKPPVVATPVPAPAPPVRQVSADLVDSDTEAAAVDSEAEQDAEEAAREAVPAWRRPFDMVDEQLKESDDPSVLFETIEPRILAASVRPRPADMPEEEFTYIVKEWLPALCKTVLAKSYLEADGPATTMVNSFLHKIIDLIMAHVDSGSPIEEMYQMLNTIIDPQAYEDVNDAADEPYKRADGDWAVLPYEHWGRVLPEFADTANYLGVKGYYQKMVAVLGDSKLDMPWKRAQSVIRVFVVLGIQGYIRERKFEDFAGAIFAGIQKRLMSMTTDDIKKVDKASLDPIYVRLKIMATHMLKKDLDRAQYYHKRCARKLETESKELKKQSGLAGNAAKLLAANNKDGKLDAGAIAAQGAIWEERIAKAIAESKKKSADLEIEQLDWWRKCVESNTAMESGVSKALPVDPIKVEMLQLEMAYKFLTFNSVPKQLLGITDIRTALSACVVKDSAAEAAKADPKAAAAAAAAEKKDDTKERPPYMVSGLFLPWLMEKRIAETMLSLDMHSEIVRKVDSILSYLARNGRLTTKHLEMLWEHSKCGYEATINVVYTTLTTCAAYYTMEQREFLFTKFQSIPAPAYDKNFLQLLFSFSVRSITASILATAAAHQAQIAAKAEFQFVPEPDTKTPAGAAAPSASAAVADTKSSGPSVLEQHEFGIRLFWKAIQYESGVPAPIQALALTQLRGSLLSAVGQRYRDTYMALCIRNLADKRSVSPALRVLSFVLESFPEAPPTEAPKIPVELSAHGVIRSEVISSLHSKFNLLKLLFLDLATYKKTTPQLAAVSAPAVADAKADVKTPPASNGGDAIAPAPAAVAPVLAGAQAEIDSRLEFLRFVLKNSKLALSKAEADLLWSFLWEQADFAERETCLKWIADACPMPDDVKVAPPPLQSQSSQNALAAAIAASLATTPAPAATPAVASPPLPALPASPIWGFSPEAAEYLFVEKLGRLPRNVFSLAALHCVDVYFRYMNGRSGTFSNAHLSKEYVLVDATKFEGLPILWEVALQADDAAVREAAANLLNILFTKPLGSDRTKTAQLFIASAMTQLDDSYKRAHSGFFNVWKAFQTAKEAAAAAEAERKAPPGTADAIPFPDLDRVRNTVELDRCLTLIDKYLTMFDAVEAAAAAASPTGALASVVGAALSAMASAGVGGATTPGGASDNITIEVKTAKDPILISIHPDRTLLELRELIAGRLTPAGGAPFDREAITLMNGGRVVKELSVKVRDANLVNNSIFANIKAGIARPLPPVPGSGGAVAPVAAPTTPTSAGAVAPVAATPVSPTAASGGSGVSPTPATQKPGWILIQTPRYFKLLFDVLSLETNMAGSLHRVPANTLTARVWALITRCPSNLDIWLKIQAAGTPPPPPLPPKDGKTDEKKEKTVAAAGGVAKKDDKQKDAKADAKTMPALVRWDELLDERNLFRLWYSLRNVDTLIFLSADTKWAQGFVSTGGFHHLIEMLSRFTHHLPPGSAVSHRLVSDGRLPDRVPPSALYDVLQAAGRRVLEIVLRSVLSFCYAYLRRNKEFLFRTHPAVLTGCGARPIYVPNFDGYLVDVSITDLCSKLVQLVADVAGPVVPELTLIPSAAALSAPVPLLPPIVAFPIPAPAVLSVNGDIANHALTLLASFALTDPLLMTVTFGQTEPWSRYVLNTLFSIDKSVRSTVAASIQQLSAKLTVGWGADADGKVEFGPLSRFTYQALAGVMQNIALEPNFQYHNQSDDYFALYKLHLLDELLLIPQTKGKAVPVFVRFYEQIWHVFRVYRSCEFTPTGVIDFVLCGMLDIMRTIFAASTPFKAHTFYTHPLITEVWRKCLWDIPEFKDSSATPPPKCKTALSRQMAFSLLTELCRESQLNHAFMHELLLSFYQNGEYTPPDAWSFEPAAHLRSAVTGYSGLKNLGCICYMNSSVQQLFAIPQFRRTILTAEPPPLPPPPAPKTPPTKPVPSPPAKGATDKPATGGAPVDPKATAAPADPKATAAPAVDPKAAGATATGAPVDPKAAVTEKGAAAAGTVAVVDAKNDSKSVAAAMAEKKDDFFFQFQSIFGNLAFSDGKHFNPVGFCNTYKGPDGKTVDIREQMDANEFLNILFDRFETRLKEAPVTQRMVADSFGGLFSNQIICDVCGNISERDEKYYTIGVTTKDKKTLESSLNSFVAGEKLSGNNKYMCINCGKKQDALMRICIKSLPSTLILHLKRFELDYETMQKKKLNEQFEFPFHLNLYPYTREGLDTRKAKTAAAPAAAAAAKPQADSKTSAPVNDESNCEYELTGVVVHTGVADGGHYYSYIKERFGDGRFGDWFEFNDSEVRPFSSDQIANQCFGGIKMTEIYDEKSGKKVTLPLPKENNAYLLFYDRVEHKKAVAVPPRDLSLVRKEALQCPLPPLIAQSVWVENSVIHRHRHVFDPKFFDFMWDFCHLQTPFVQLDYPKQQANKVGQLPSVNQFRLASSFVFETLFRANDKSKLAQWTAYLKQLITESTHTAISFLDELGGNLQPNAKPGASPATWAQNMLLSCTDEKARIAAVDIFMTAVRLLAPMERGAYAGFAEKKEFSSVCSFMEHACNLVLRASVHWRHFGQLWTVFKEFASIGVQERVFLLNHQIISECVAVVMNRESPTRGKLFPNLVLRIDIGSKNVPNYTDMLETFAIICTNCITTMDKNDAPSPAPQAPPSTTGGVLIRELIPPERDAVYEREFLLRVLKLNPNANALSRLLCHWSWCHPGFSKWCFDNLAAAIDKYDADDYPPIFLCYTNLLSLNDNLVTERVNIAMPKLLATMEANVQYIRAITAACRFVLTLSIKFPAVAKWMLRDDNRKAWAWTEEFVRANPDAGKPL